MVVEGAASVVLVRALAGLLTVDAGRPKRSPTAVRDRSAECSTVTLGGRSTELSTVAGDGRPEGWLTIADGCGGCGLCGVDVVVEGAASVVLVRALAGLSTVDAGRPKRSAITDVVVDELMVLPFPSCA
jgi:hypothetical protein